MKSILEFLSYKETNEITAACDILSGKSSNDVFAGYKTEVCMPDFEDKTGKEVRTVSVDLYKNNKEQPDYIFAVWGGPEYGEMSLARNIEKLFNGDNSDPFDEVSFNKHSGSIQIKYKNQWWSIMLFTKDDYKNIIYIER